MQTPCKVRLISGMQLSVGQPHHLRLNEEVEKIRKWHPKCSLLIRLKAPDDGGARCPLGPKYGALPEEVTPLLQAAHAARLVVSGVFFHVGSGATHSRAYRGAIAAAKTVFDTATRLGMPHMHILNIGGGFWIGMVSDSDPYRRNNSSRRRQLLCSQVDLTPTNIATLRCAAEVPTNDRRVLKKAIL
ncbi:hypothetical protein IFM89_008567 [Coptis chinensis]|uniref:Orn/DAP/Arg decarboxylase 2 N-terminal domain-containing protein n=1 Tax=Coptis chinensis TaxID=261450 RepID=A0A835I1D5_9MAGN|nr:hypothetical protein IFM89_008567 [Coptis chinensis]